MESVWYYARDGAQAGPVSFEDLKAAVASGQIRPNDLVWREGTPDWVPARSVSGLSPGPGSAPAALATATPAPQPAMANDATPRPAAARQEPISIYDEQRSWPTGEKPTAADYVALAKLFVRRAAATNPATLAPTEEEAEKLAGLEPTAKKYAIWRRAVLWVAVVPTTIAGLFGLFALLGMERAQKESFSGFGFLLLYLQAFSVFALPATAVLAALAFDNLSKSARLVLLGGLISLCVPIAIAFVPAEWFFDVKTDSSMTLAQHEAQRTALGLGLGIIFYLTLTPLILSLLPAVSRACIRTKGFLPESMVPGWGLVASIPLFVLLTLTTFVIVYHTASNAILLILGLVLWIGAPLLYLTKFKLLTRPVADPKEMEQLARTQLIVLAAIAAGVLFLVIYLFTAKVGGETLVGFEKDKSHYQIWSVGIHAKWIEYIGRSLFLTVLFADLLVRMAVMVWREERAFAGTPAAAGFDKTMSGLGAAVETKAAPPVA